MADTTFVNRVTPITAEWLNDVNDAVYGPTFPTGTLGASLASTASASVGAGLNGWLYSLAYARATVGGALNGLEISVDWFSGVDRTGATDSTTGIRAAFAFLRLVGSGTLVFTRGGTYKMSGGFGTDPTDFTDLAHNCHIRGYGATISVDFTALAASIRVITLEGNNVSVKGLTFTSTRVFEMFDTDPTTYRTIQIIGVEIGGKAASYNGLTDNVSYYKQTAAVEDCTFRDINAPIIMTQTSHGKIRGNDLQSYTQTGIVVWGCPSDVEVSGNKVDLGSDDCIFLYNPNGSGSAWTLAANYAGDHKVFGNTLSRTRAKFVGTGGYSDVLIYGNTCDQSLNSGMVIEGDSTIFATGSIYNRNIRIFSNTIRKAGRFYSTTSGYAYWTGPVATENHGISLFRSPGVRATTTLPFDVDIYDNVVDNPSGNGIEVGYCDLVKVRGNTVLTGTNDQGAGNVNTSGYAIRTSDVTKAWVTDNTVSTTSSVAWLKTYLIEDVGLASGDVHVKNNRVGAGESWQGAIDPATSSKLDYDSIQNGASYGYLKPSPGGATVAALASWGFNGESAVVEFWRAPSGTPNAADAGMKVRMVAANSRSINAAGTVNASGADYAEYMRKASGCGAIPKGAIVGINASGELTDKFDEAVSFVVKSTDPSFVGGDSWGGDLEGDDLDAARQQVDRIAFAGQVPVSVRDANPGEYIVPIKAGEGIAGIAVSTPTFEQYRNSVGRVIAIEADGRARIIVKVS
jgi:hypothetical protein